MAETSRRGSLRPSRISDTRSESRGVFAQGVARSLLLGFLLRRALSAGTERPKTHFDDEPLVVVWSDLSHDAVLGELHPVTLGQLLESGLVIVEEQVVPVDPPDVLEEGMLDHPSRGIDPAVEVDAGDDGLEQIGEQRVLLPPAGLLFTDAEENNLAHPEATRLGGETGGAHEISLHLRERSLVELRELVEQQVTDHESENGVTEKLEGFVVSRSGLARFVRIRLVRKRPLEKIATPERVTDALLELRDFVFHRRQYK
jgi:hypothetical protein